MLFSIQLKSLGLIYSCKIRSLNFMFCRSTTLVHGIFLLLASPRLLSHDCLTKNSGWTLFFKRVNRQACPHITAFFILQ